MRLAIIGHGSQARLHAGALQRLAGVEIAGVGARDPERAHAFAREFGVRADLAAHLLDDKRIDAAIIATPTATHAALTCAALARGKHVFCECPMAWTLSEADAMIDAAQRARRVLQIGLLHRFELPYEHLVSAIRSGKLGAVRAIETTRLSAHLADGEQKPHHGDAIEELLTFDMHFLSWAFGKPASLHAQTIDIDGRSRHASAIIAYPGFVATCTASSFLPAGHPFTEHTRVFADGGVVELELRLAPQIVSWRYELTRPHAEPERIAVPGSDPIRAQMKHFVALATGVGGVNRADGQVARDVLKLTLSVASAARSGRTVVL
jgi:UDP-N-acetylglucosamine 3-dehydrogenase